MLLGINSTRKAIEIALGFTLCYFNRVTCAIMVTRAHTIKFQRLMFSDCALVDFFCLSPSSMLSESS